jgi:hypothetical protein
VKEEDILVDSSKVIAFAKLNEENKVMIIDNISNSKVLDFGIECK